MPAAPPQVVKAKLTALPGGDPIEVHFNPSSLVYSVENSVAQQSSGPSKSQYVAQFSGKLTMDLQFDTTEYGYDVRIDTNAVARFMEATGNAQAKSQNSAPPSAGGASPAPAKAPPVLLFEWGTYSFQGVMDSFKETVDFFSSDGVALRALVSIGLSRQDKVFDDSGLSGQSTAGSLVPTSSTDSALSLATRGGNPGAARLLGAANGLASLRFTAGASLEVSAGVTFNPPTAFVTPPSAGLSIGGGIGVSGGAGFGVSAGAGIGASAGAGFSLGASSGSGLGASFGGSASAGVPATAGAFAGLQIGRAKVTSTASLNPLQMMPATISTDVSTFPGASFSLGGAANNTGSAGLSTNVGSKLSFSDRLTFSTDH